MIRRPPARLPHLHPPPAVDRWLGCPLRREPALRPETTATAGSIPSRKRQKGEIHRKYTRSTPEIYRRYTGYRPGQHRVIPVPSRPHPALSPLAAPTSVPSFRLPDLDPVLSIHAPGFETRPFSHLPSNGSALRPTNPPINNPVIHSQSAVYRLAPGLLANHFTSQRQRRCCRTLSGFQSHGA